MATLPKKPLEMTSPRDTDELEGSLLPPVAVPVEENPQLAAAAVPVEAFVYDADNNHDSSLQQDATADFPTAPILPNYPSSTTREEEEQQAIARGKRRGMIAAEAEKESIRMASREQYSKAYHAKRQVEVANEEARRRNMEGVQVTEDKYDRPAAEKKKEEDEELAFPSMYKGGYEVNEYETTEYNASDNYEVSEYKSVYER